jgi:hypothetical protein
MKVVDLNSDPARNPDVVLEKAKGQYESVVVIGYDNEGILDVRASTNQDAKSILFMMEQFKNKLLNGDYRDEE